MGRSGDKFSRMTTILAELEDILLRCEHVDPRHFLRSDNSEEIARKLVLPAETLLNDALSLFCEIQDYLNVPSSEELPGWLVASCKRLSVVGLGAQLELENLRKSLEKEGPTTHRSETFERCDVVRQRTSHLAGSMLQGLECTRRSEQWLELSLDESVKQVTAVRRLFADFRRTIASLQSDEGLSVRERLAGALQALTMILANKKSEYVRLKDLTLLLDLQARLSSSNAQRSAPSNQNLSALKTFFEKSSHTTDASSDAGLRLWEDVIQTSQDLMGINNRHDLRTNDAKLLACLREALRTEEPFKKDPRKFAHEFSDLIGMDAKLDDQLNAMALGATLTEVLGNLYECVDRLLPDASTSEFYLPKHLRG